MQMLIMGPPGAGKGTQAAYISKRYSVPQISTGDMFRQAIKDGTELGLSAKSYMDKGDLVPDEVTVGIVRERLSKSDCKAGFLLDGFPRTVDQAKALEKILSDLNLKLTHVLDITVSEDRLIERAEGRRICKDCGATYHTKFNPTKAEGKCDNCGGELYQRSDDTAATMKTRLKNYAEKTRPLTEYYQQVGIYKAVNGDQSIDKVRAEIDAILSEEN